MARLSQIGGRPTISAPPVMESDASPNEGERIRYVLLHLLNADIQRFIGLAQINDPRLIAVLRLQVRLGILASRFGVVMPATSLFEFEAGQRLLEGTAAYQRSGQMWLYSPTSDLEAYAEKKIGEYRTQRDLFGRYDASAVKRAVKAAGRIPWLARLERSAFADLSSAWHGGFSEGGQLLALARQPIFDGRPPSEREIAALEQVPQKLEGRAFTLNNILETVGSPLHPRGVGNIARYNNREYVLSYIGEHRATIFVDTNVGDVSFGITGDHAGGVFKALSMERYQACLRSIGILDVIISAATPEVLLDLKTNSTFQLLNDLLLDQCRRPSHAFALRLQRIYLDLREARRWFEFPSTSHFLHERVHRIYDGINSHLDVGSLTGEKLAVLPATSSPGVRNTASRPKKRRPTDQHSLRLLDMNDKATVFLVHGKDIKAARWMRDFLRSIGLEPIEWSHAVALTGSGSPFVLDVVRAGMAAACATVVLFTPDEDVQLRAALLVPGEPNQAGSQSRPNVWFEAGLAMAMHPERTIFATVGRHRPASDLAGVHFITLGSEPTSLHELAQRLKAVGCDVNLTGSDYLTRSVEYSA